MATVGMAVGGAYGFNGANGGTPRPDAVVIPIMGCADWMLGGGAGWRI